MEYCANCDTEAVGNFGPNNIPLCFTCKTAYEWGATGAWFQNAELLKALEPIEGVLNIAENTDTPLSQSAVRALADQVTEAIRNLFVPGGKIDSCMDCRMPIDRCICNDSQT